MRDGSHTVIKKYKMKSVVYAHLETKMTKIFGFNKQIKRKFLFQKLCEFLQKKFSFV